MPLVLLIAVLFLSFCPQPMLNLGLPDWIGHAVAYGMLMVMAIRRLDGRVVDIAIAVFAIGLVVELAQSLTPDRSTSLEDLLANAVGILFGILYTMRRSALVVCGMLSLAGCAATETPRNAGPVAREGGFQPTQRSIPAKEHELIPVESALAVCKANTQFDDVPVLPRSSDESAISRGDLLRVSIGEDPLLSGDYEIEDDGKLRLPKVTPLRAHGVTSAALSRSVSVALINEHLYRAAPSVSVKIIERASVRVYVEGAVFEPGTVEIAMRSAENRDLTRQAAFGDSTHARGLVAAIQSSAGLRPDADTQRVLLKRNGKVWRLDLRPAAINQRFHDPMLLSGDAIHVPSLGCFQPGLARPTVVTRKGIKVHLSNLTVPAQSNAQSAIDDDVREIKYGTRLLQALVRMNCVGGTALTNADRSAVLISRNPATDRTEVIERRIEDLVRRSDRDNHDPVLMPGDAIACYDSSVTNARDVARSIIEVASPVSLIRGGL